MTPGTPRSESAGLVARLASELAAFGLYVRDAVTDPALRDALCATLGMALPGVNMAPAQPAGSAVTPGSSTIAQYIQGEDVDPLALLEALGQHSKSIREPLQNLFEESEMLALDLLATRYVYEKHPALYFCMQFVGWIAETSSEFGEGYTTTDRALAAVVGLMGFLCGGKPVARLASEGDAQAVSKPTLRLAALVLLILRIAKSGKFENWAKQDVLDMLYGWDALPPEHPGVLVPVADQISQRMLSVRLQAEDADDDPAVQAGGNIGVSMALVPKAHGGPGMFLALSGEESVDFSLLPWLRVKAELQTATMPLWLAPGFAPTAAQGGRAAIRLTTQETPKRRMLLDILGNILGFGLKVGGAEAKASIDSDAGPSLDLSLRDVELSFDGSGFDGFIGKLMPDRKTTVKFNIGARYVSGSGMSLTGEVKDASSKKVDASPAPAPAQQDPEPLPLLPGGERSPGGLQKRIALGKSLGPVRLDDLQLGVTGSASDPEPRADLTAAVALSAHIGPVFARVDHLGLRVSVSRPKDLAKANLLVAHVDVGWLPPRAVGITVDAKAVKGGGYVFYDPDKKQYAGVLELEIAGQVSVKAIGLISTRLPNEAKGYSVVIIITAEGFKPIRLPMGFALTGIGGLMAIHRTCSEEALREGLRTRSLDQILFPIDPVQNADGIITTLDRVFPAQHGSYVLGPMLRITWASIITMDLALLIEWGVRDRVIVLGRISAVLPNVDNDLLHLRMDALGVIDFDQGTAAVDAVLVDSKLLGKFVLTGAMALRMRWSSPRSFALAVGGMHSGFTPPAGFPKLERLALNLTTGNNPRFTCESYFALTSNTVQFGALAHLYAEGPWGFNVTGDAGYDVLITLSPFHFLAEFMAGMQIRKGTRNLFKVKVTGALEGPMPLALRARVAFEVCWLDVSIPVNVTLVGGASPPLPLSVNALAQLLAALSDTRNWHGELAPGQSHIVVLREAQGSADAAAPIAVHPLATLAVRQSVVPLNAEPIDHFGDAPVSGERRFSIASVTVNGVIEPAPSVQTLKEDFAPAQFFNMPDEAKLTSPSFEAKDAGVQIGGAQMAFRFDQCVSSRLDYETKLIDRSVAPGLAQRITPLHDAFVLTGGQLAQQARYGAAGRSTLRRVDPPPADASPAPLVSLRPLAFALMDVALMDMAHASSAMKATDRARTVPQVATAIASAPVPDAAPTTANRGRVRRMQSVPAFELAG